MCRFNPALADALAEKDGLEEVVMKGKLLKGYCYVGPEGLRTKKQFDCWMGQCLAFTIQAKASEKRK